MSSVLALDIGTGSLKAALVGDSLEIKGAFKIPYPILTPREGWAESDPESWWRAFLESLKALGERIKTIDRISLSVLCPALIPMDEEGNPLSVDHND